jgi:toxic protein SymE
LAYAHVATATPSGITEGAAYRKLKESIIAGIRAELPVDGVLLALHGAGVADGVDDIEGDLASAVRALIGPNVPMAAVYDLHGNLTEIMRDACDLTLPCKLYPHTDLMARGEEAVTLLLKVINGTLKPVTSTRPIPMLPQIVSTRPGLVPAEVNNLCRTLGEQPGVIDCSWFHGFPFADIASPCPTAICTTDGDAALAARCTDEVAKFIWQNRRNFPQTFMSPEEGVFYALQTNDGPVIINENADNPGGGTPGDGTYLLRALLDAAPPPGTTCFASINDPEVVRLAVAAGVGHTVHVSLGGKQGKYQGQPVEAEAYIKCISDGRFVNRAGSVLEGVNFDLGTMCRLIIRGVDVIVASRAEQIFDEMPFALHGIDVTKRRVVALKGANHFRAGFEDVAREIVTVDSPGLSTAAVTSFPRSRLAQPMWPSDDAVRFTNDI